MLLHPHNGLSLLFYLIPHQETSPPSLPPSFIALLLFSQPFSEINETSLSYDDEVSCSPLRLGHPLFLSIPAWLLALLVAALAQVSAK